MPCNKTIDLEEAVEMGLVPCDIYTAEGELLGNVIAFNITTGYVIERNAFGTEGRKTPKGWYEKLNHEYYPAPLRVKLI